MTDARYELEDLVVALCSTGSTNLDQTKLNELKNICKADDSNIKYCYEILITYLNKEHSEIRYSAFQIIDCLFHRSHLFRELILDDFQTIFELVLEVNLDNPLPPPRKTAIELKKLATRTIKIWHDKFSDVYKLLELGFNYLKNSKKIDFVSFSHQTNAQRAHAEKVNQKQQILLNKKYTEYVQQMNEYEEDIKNCISQLERCINILIPKPDDLFANEDFKIPQSKLPPTCVAKESNQFHTSKISNSDIVMKQDKEHEISKASNHEDTTNYDDDGDGGDDSNSDDDDDDDDDEFEEVPMEKNEVDQDTELRYLGFFNDKSSEFTRNFNLELDINIKLNEENKILIDIMRDLYKELKNSSLEKINIWIKNFTNVKQASVSLKKAIELKNSVQQILKKFTDLKIPIDDLKTKQKSELDPNKPEIDESMLPGTSKSKNCLTDHVEDLIRNSLKENKNELIENNANESEEELKKKRRQKLLKIAPVIDLEEFQFCAPVTQKVETSHPMYQRREMDLSDEQTLNMPSLTKKTFIGKFEPVKWKCRAPIKNGKLCPRMDRFKCPLHGKIVARDELGNIVNENDKNDPQVKSVNSDKNNEPAPWQDAALIADINSALGKKIEIVKKSGKKFKKKNLKMGNLTDISKEDDSPRKRLEKRLLNSKNLSKVGSILDSIERRLYHEKFHHNFNYSLSS